jgi:small subunit ribosomal protein S11e
MKRTLVVRRDYLQYFSKYRRFGKKHKNMSVHCSPAFANVGEGDIVTIGQCRPLAKTVRFNVIEHFPAVNKVSSTLIQPALHLTNTCRDKRP